jgi:lysophospholipase L1-like esterase
MKRLSIYILLFSIMLSLSCMNKKKKKILFFGDSITELGINPGGYIDLLKTKLDTATVDLTGSGISGNKIYDLYLRMEEDVLKNKPDVVVIWVGVNDVWHKSLLGTGTDADKFAKFYEATIKKMQANKIELVLCTPAVIGEKINGANPQDNDLNLYADIIRALAAHYKCRLCDLREIFMNYIAANNKEMEEEGILTYDRVHLNAKGNELVANALYNELKKQ